MSSITRKMFLSILAVVLTVFALGTTTFAWFTLTNTSTIQPFEAQIVADSGIEVALGAHATVYANPEDANWVTTLTTETVEAYLNDTYGNQQIFNHVTTADGVNFFTLGSSAMTSTSSGYIELPLNFRSDTANQINWTTIALTSASYNWTIDVNFTGVGDVALTSGGTLAVDASNGMRIAMLSDASYGSFTVAYEKPASAANVALNTGGDLRGTLVDPDSTPASGDEYYPGVAGAMSYYYAKNSTLPFGVDAVTTLSTMTDLGSGQPVITMADVSASGSDFGAQYYGQVTVRIWLEGWDANTYNSILSQMVTSAFTFQGVSV